MLSRSMKVLSFLFCTIGLITSIILSGIYFFNEHKPNVAYWLLSLCLIFVVLSFISYICMKESSSPRPRQLPTIKPDTSSYSDIVQLFLHADRLNWERLYYFLVFNSIMFLACTGFVTKSSNCYLGRDLLLSSFSFIGLLVSIVWGPVAIRRGIFFQNYYMKWACSIEEEEKKKNKLDGPFTIQDAFAKGSTIHFQHSDVSMPNDVLFFGLGAREFAACIPWLFVFGYLMLLIFSLKLLIDKLLSCML